MGARKSMWTTSLVIAGIGGLALYLGPRIPNFNAVVVALILGIAVANFGRFSISANEDVTDFMLKRVLKVAIVLLGAGINVAIVADIGFAALTAIVLAVVVAMSTAMILGKSLGLERRLTVLIGVGTAICGASAIAAVAPVIKARREEIGAALATIFTFNAVALVVYPAVGSLLGVGDVFFGTWAGIGVHDTATSVATGFAYSESAGEVATLIKLTRTLFLIPLVLVVASWQSASSKSEARGRAIVRSFPWFVLGFIVLATANSLGWLGSTAELASNLAKLIIVFVVASVGASLRISKIMTIGRPLAITGFVASLLVGLVAFWVLSAAAIT